MSTLKLPTLIYAALDAALPSRSTEAPRGAGRSHTIAYKTRAYRFQDSICIQHHDTTIAMLGADGTVHVRNDGYDSSTTRARLHCILMDNGIPYRLGQRNFVQVLVNRNGSKVYPGFVSASFAPDGTLLTFNGEVVTA